MFDAASDTADECAFAERCVDDRHHFRFIISPEDAAEIGDLKTFTRELMLDVEKDLGTKLDWVAVDHWNTDNPHVHVLIRGRADDGQDLVISREYISRGFRDRAAERVTLELGPRSEQEIGTTLEREVESDRWTSLDRALRDISDECGGVADLRPGPDAEDPELRRLLLGRAAKLERLGLADPVGPACWTLKPCRRAYCSLAFGLTIAKEHRHGFLDEFILRDRQTFPARLRIHRRGEGFGDSGKLSRIRCDHTQGSEAVPIQFESRLVRTVTAIIHFKNPYCTYIWREDVGW